MISPGLGLQRYRPVGTFDEPVSQIGVAFIVARVVFIIAVYIQKDVPVDSTIAAPDLGLAEFECDIEFAFPVALEIAPGRALFQISRSGRPGPELLLGEGLPFLQHRL